ncbi:MAG: D-glycero-beta-D-manno-heptose 1-phosphate adenylyltransferase [Acidobacteriota bacterium]
MIPSETLAWRAAQRLAHKRVAFTNGCFDLLHTGHLALLTAARQAADALIVAVNTDSSTRRLKGDKRPIVPELERVELLLALEPVDQVVLFDEDTPLQAILALHPDVLVKGADWSEENIVGAAEVKGWGGEVVRVPLRAGLSTTNLVQRVLDVYGKGE